MSYNYCDIDWDNIETLIFPPEIPKTKNNRKQLRKYAKSVIKRNHAAVALWLYNNDLYINYFDNLQDWIDHDQLYLSGRADLGYLIDASLVDDNLVDDKQATYHTTVKGFLLDSLGREDYNRLFKK